MHNLHSLKPMMLALVLLVTAVVMTSCYTKSQSKSTYLSSTPIAGNACIKSCLDDRSYCMQRAKRNYPFCEIPSITVTGNTVVEHPNNPSRWAKDKIECRASKSPINESCGDMQRGPSSCKAIFDSCMEECGAKVQTLRVPMCWDTIE